MSFINYSRALINENKWRAARYGIDGNLIDFGKEIEVNCRNLILELLDFVDDVVDELGCREDVNYVLKILANGTGADRQLAVYEQTGSFESVVDYVTSQTLIGAK
jgi:carboxylate-amine ligase